MKSLLKKVFWGAKAASAFHHVLLVPAHPSLQSSQVHVFPRLRNKSVKIRIYTRSNRIDPTIHFVASGKLDCEVKTGTQACFSLLARFLSSIVFVIA